eukprot:404966-Amphidinium_carterae.4
MDGPLAALDHGAGAKWEALSGCVFAADLTRPPSSHVESQQRPQGRSDPAMHVPLRLVQGCSNYTSQWKDSACLGGPGVKGDCVSETGMVKAGQDNSRVLLSLCSRKLIPTHRRFSCIELILPSAPAVWKVRLLYTSHNVKDTDERPFTHHGTPKTLTTPETHWSRALEPSNVGTEAAVCSKQVARNDTISELWLA